MTRERVWFIFVLIVLCVLAVALAIEFSSEKDNGYIENSKPTFVEPAPESDERPSTQIIENAAVKDDCFITGCSNQVCTDNRELATTCEWHETYSCYNNATCERQPDGECGWTRTEALMQCLSAQIPDLDTYVNNI